MVLTISEILFYGPLYSIPVIIAIVIAKPSYLSFVISGIFLLVFGFLSFLILFFSFEDLNQGILGMMILIITFPISFLFIITGAILAWRKRD
ncbi:hypothetical protein DH09_11700 [Bacillaceae bacterium JMAK1]|nr:hypothetical protein DH09_11700 [Bacillaceae bacterium JMAK1]